MSRFDIPTVMTAEEVRAFQEARRRRRLGYGLVTRENVAELTAGPEGSRRNMSEEDRMDALRGADAFVR
jgi:hypothetical protein